MKKIAVVAVLVMALTWCGMAFAFENEPEGFRGLKWGDPPTEDMVLLPPSTQTQMEYVRTDEKLQLGRARFQEIIYSFYCEDEMREFMMVFLHFKGESNYKLLETICKNKFGEPTKEQFDQLVWLGLHASVMLRYDLLNETGLLMLADNWIIKKHERARQKEEAESAEEDW